MKRSIYHLTSFALAIACFATDGSANSSLGARGGQSGGPSAQARATSAPVTAQLNGGRVGTKNGLGGHFNARPTTAPGAQGLNGGRFGSPSGLDAYRNAPRPSPTGKALLDSGRVGSKNGLGGHFNGRSTPAPGTQGLNGRFGSKNGLDGHYGARPQPAPAKLGFGAAKNGSSVVKVGGNAARDLAPTRPDEQFFFHSKNSVQNNQQGNRSRSSTRGGR